MSATVRIKSSHSETQGPFVEINESDFDPAKHERYDVPPPPPGPVVPPPAKAAPVDPLANLPPDWRTKDARKIAAAVSGRAVENNAQAIQVIEAELAKRAAPAAPATGEKASA